MLALQALIRCRGNAAVGMSCAVKLQQQGDNMPVVATLGREFTTTEPLCFFTLALEAINHRCQIQPIFCPGERNDWADGLSRGKDHVSILFQSSRRVQLALAEFLQRVCE